MLRAFLLSLLLLLRLEAVSLDEGYTLLAASISSDGDTVDASGDVLIYSASYSFRADRAHYVPSSGDLSLYGNVDILLNGKVLTKINETIFNVKQKTFNGEKLFAYDAESELWFNAKIFEGKASHYRMRDTTISSCSREDPDWKITFTKGTYHHDKEYISIYNPTFYAGELPVLYLPWFGFSTNKTRQTGFLKPFFGYENRDNFYFVLPYYIAGAKNWDLEIDPQIRLDRGLGLYSTLRFVDSNHSFGQVNVGLFDEKRSYFEEKNLENRTHYGVEVKYQSSALLTEAFHRDDFQDGLWVDATYLNDIDYINLDHKKGWANSRLVTSKVNYVAQREDDFLGLYAKYFIDTEKTSNVDTLQTLPSLQYHRFSRSMAIPNLLYSLDYKFKNNFRREGLNAKQHELAIPLTFHKSLWGDFFTFKASENFYYSRVNYTEGNRSTATANYFSNYHQLSLSSDLTKDYGEYIHNLQADVTVTLPSFERKDGYFADFIPFNLETKSFAFKLNQYYYDQAGFDFFTHRVRQVIYDDDTIYKYSDLENQMIYKFSPNFIVSNTMFYSHKYDKIRKWQSTVDYKNARYNFGFNHTYEYKEAKKNSNFITADFLAKVDSHYNVFGSLDYDMENGFTKEWSLGWQMKKRCWDYKFRYRESVIPSLTSAGTESLVKRGFLFFVRFSPFGGMAYDFNRESKLTQVQEVSP